MMVALVRDIDRQIRQGSISHHRSFTWPLSPVNACSQHAASGAQEAGQGICFPDQNHPEHPWGQMQP